MNKKWFLALMSAMMAAVFAVGCNFNDEEPPPPENGYEEDGTMPQEELPPVDEDRDQDLDMDQDLQNGENLDQDMMENENQ